MYGIAAHELKVERIVMKNGCVIDDAEATPVWHNNLNGRGARNDVRRVACFRTENGLVTDWNRN